MNNRFLGVNFKADTYTAKAGKRFINKALSLL